jgi:hypothetical protein
MALTKSILQKREKKQKCRHHEREYNLKYLEGLVMCFIQRTLKQQLKKGRNPTHSDPRTDSQEYITYFYSSTFMKVMGIDVIWLSAAVECVNGK